MADDLVKRLRQRYFRKGYETEAEAKERRQREREEAADRIEALERERDEALSEYTDMMWQRRRAEERTEDAEAALAKAVGVLRWYAESIHDDAGRRAEAVLAEIEGGGRMSDDLIAILQDWPYMGETYAKEAAARIEALERERVLSKAAYDSVSSLLLSVQQDCIKEHNRAEAAEAKLAKVEISMQFGFAEYERRLATARAERDEALNQLDSARHSIDVLEKRVRVLIDGSGA